MAASASIPISSGIMGQSLEYPSDKLKSEQRSADCQHCFDGPGWCCEVSYSSHKIATSPGSDQNGPMRIQNGRHNTHSKEIKSCFEPAC